MNDKLKRYLDFVIEEIGDKNGNRIRMSYLKNMYGITRDMYPYIVNNLFIGMSEYHDNLYLYNTPITDLHDLKIVNGSVFLYNTSIKSLGNLEIINGTLDLHNTPIESLGKIKKIKGNLDLHNTPIKDFGDLKEIEGSVDLYNTPLGKKYSKDEIRLMVKVNGWVYL